MEVGIDRFAARPPGKTAMAATSSRDALAQLLERIEYADKLGLDTFGIGALGGISRVTFQTDGAELSYEQLLHSLEIIARHVAPIINRQDPSVEA